MWHACVCMWQACVCTCGMYVCVCVYMWQACVCACGRHVCRYGMSGATVMCGLYLSVFTHTRVSSDLWHTEWSLVLWEAPWPTTHVAPWSLDGWLSLCLSSASHNNPTIHRPHMKPCLWNRYFRWHSWICLQLGIVFECGRYFGDWGAARILTRSVRCVIHTCAVLRNA